MAQYSSSAAINSISAPDDNIEVRGYVDAVPERQIVGSAGRRLNVFKFVLNNDSGKRIQCLAWEKEIDRIENLISMNKILHIEAVQAKPILNQRYNLGNAHFELTVRFITTIEDEGVRVQIVEPNIDVPVTEWDDIADMEGEKIAVVGWIKCNFRESRHFNNESSYGFGSITNGALKLEVRLTSLAGLPDGLERGTPVKISGTVNFGSYLYLKLDSGANVEAIDGGRLNPVEMINITTCSQQNVRDWNNSFLYTGVLQFFVSFFIIYSRTFVKSRVISFNRIQIAVAVLNFLE